MELLLERKYCKDKYTVGRLYIDGVFFSNTLEDKVRDTNKNGKFDINGRGYDYDGGKRVFTVGEGKFFDEILEEVLKGEKI